MNTNTLFTVMMSKDGWQRPIHTIFAPSKKEAEKELEFELQEGSSPLHFLNTGNDGFAEGDPLFGMWLEEGEVSDPIH